MAKQILQVGMGDAIDDGLLIQGHFLRREDVVASSINWVNEVCMQDVGRWHASKTFNVGSFNLLIFQVAF
jgi:hypothetical protein